MPRQDLVAAFATALANRTPAPAKPRPATPAARTPVPDDETLLNALRNSTTGRDQIMQRRIGLRPDDPGN